MAFDPLVYNAVFNEDPLEWLAALDVLGDRLEEQGIRPDLDPYPDLKDQWDQNKDHTKPDFRLLATYGWARYQLRHLFARVQLLSTIRNGLGTAVSYIPLLEHTYTPQLYEQWLPINDWDFRDNCFTYPKEIRFHATGAVPSLTHVVVTFGCWDKVYSHLPITILGVESGQIITLTSLSVPNYRAPSNLRSIY